MVNSPTSTQIKKVTSESHEDYEADKSGMMGWSDRGNCVRAHHGWNGWGSLACENEQRSPRGVS